jgi:NTP pyrophosphatase (non-canonical NTP hydrolase)
LSSDIDRLQDAVRAFAEARDWEQFHTPKNLAMALAAEAGELLEIFQWLTPEESRLEASESAFESARSEIADVLIYALRLTDVLQIDLVEAIEAKMQMNASRYPVQLAKGNAAKR